MTKNSELPLNEIQNALIQEKLDGWLLYDFRGSNPVARSIAKLADHITTRRWYYFIPAKGSPVRVVHAIEATNLDHLPGEKIIFRTWQDLRSALTRGLKGAKKVAMEYSPENDVPYISLVDAGTIELLRSTGAEVVSSADLVQMFEARWT
ncbi:MAG TPA: aminopeptidase P family protein, partial [Acidobacteriota bacterium]|nr:aminopeptidase P family protein [Acidobacteriota bacterium]